jgi:hypothetical protein
MIEEKKLLRNEKKQKNHQEDRRLFDHKRLFQMVEKK